MRRIYSNTAVGAFLAAPLTDDATTLLVDDVSTWPTPTAGEVTVAAIGPGTAEIEVITYTGRTADTLTGVTRGVDGTTPREHSAGVRVFHAASAKDIEAIRTELRETGGPTILVLGAIADGEFLRREGNTVVGGEAAKLHYTHHQGVAATTWTVEHNLGVFPSVTVVDSANQEVVGSVTYIDTNTLEVSFAAAFSGKAYVN